jgi:hypothetical protein
MLTREQCKVLVNRPGKFEGEEIYSPYFYEIMMQGDSDEVGEDNVDVFIITDEDRALFPELEGVKKLIQYTDDNGFVYTLIPSNDL